MGGMTGKPLTRILLSRLIYATIFMVVFVATAQVIDPGMVATVQK